MLIPDSNGISKQFSVRTSLIIGISAVILVFVITSIFLSAEFFSNKVSQKELKNLKAENKEIKDKYEQLRWNVAEIESRYQNLINKEVTIRTAFDLPEINAEERQLGIGGPVPKAVASMTEMERVAYSSEVEVERLLKLSEYELKKFEEVEEALGNIKDRLDHTPSIWPTKGWLSSGFGMRSDPFTGYKQMHRGIDISNHTGTPIIAPADGKVKLISKSGKIGMMLVLDHGYGFQTRYGHLSKVQVKRGQKVKRGDVIALMGSTGYTTGPHLHYEVIRNGKFYNPMSYILNEK